MSFLLLMILLLFDVVFGDGMYKDDDMREKKKTVLKECVYHICLIYNKNKVNNLFSVNSIHLDKRI